MKPFEKQAFFKFTAGGEEYDGEIEAVLTEFNARDLDNDEIMDGALDDWLAENSELQIRWQHSRMDVIGSWSNFRIENDQFLATGQLLEGIQRAAEAVVLIKEDLVTGVSMGFRSTEYKWRYNREVEGGDFGIDFVKIQPFEASLVSEAAVPNARVTGMKDRTDEIADFMKSHGLGDDDIAAMLRDPATPPPEKSLAGQLLDIL